MYARGRLGTFDLRWGMKDGRAYMGYGNGDGDIVGSVREGK